MSACRITYVGACTALIEVAGLRLLTDPVFDPPGGRYSIGWGTGSRKLTGPALAADAIASVDAVLLSHDQHADNLDRAGRELLPRATRVLTTQRGATRLGANARGLAPWTRFDLDAQGTRVRVVATPARHGPPLSRPIVGDVIGFLLTWEGQRHGALYLSGDTVWFKGVAEVAQRFDVGTFVPFLGGVRFAVSGPARYTLTGRPAGRAGDRGAAPEDGGPAALRGLVAPSRGPRRGAARVRGRRPGRAAALAAARGVGGARRLAGGQAERPDASAIQPTADSVRPRPRDALRGAPRARRAAAPRAHGQRPRARRRSAR